MGGLVAIGLSFLYSKLPKAKPSSPGCGELPIDVLSCESSRFEMLATSILQNVILSRGHLNSLLQPQEPVFDKHDFERSFFAIDVNPISAICDMGGVPL